MNESYIRYLNTPEWKERRKQFLEDENYECEDCGEKATQVHHENYDSLGEEERDDVAILCKSCHEDREIEKGTDLEESGDYGTW